MSTRSLTVAALCVAIGACKRETPPAPIAVKEYIQPDTPPTYAAPRGATAPKISFTDITRSAGLDYVHVNGTAGDKWMPETMGGGGGFFDYDADGWADVVLINSGYWPGRENGRPPATHALYRNRRDGTFENVSEASGLSKVSGYGMGFTAADFDGDGDQDLYVTAVGKNQLLRNDAGRFTDITDEAGVGFSRCQGEASTWEWSTGAAWIDHDRDGDLDLLVCNYVQWTPQTDIWSTLDGKTKSYATPQPYPGMTNVLFRNNGDGTFTDATKSAGVFNPEGKSLSVVADDFNDDGFVDLFISNDTQPNFLYINNRDGIFTDRALSAGVGYDEAGLTRAGMGVAVADLENRGRRSIAVGNFSGEPLSLFTQVGVETFVDRAGAARISNATNPSLTFGVLFADFDLDGYEDLLLANGHIEPDIARVHDGWVFEQSPQLFLNNRVGQFVEMTERAGPGFSAKLVGRSAAAADIDHDGDLDVLLTANGGPARLLRNDSSDRVHGIRVRLVGSDKNREAIGSTIRVREGDRVQTRFITTGGSYLSQSELAATFGLGQETKAVTVDIRWPDGTETRQPNLNPGALHIMERTGVTRSEPFHDP